MCFSEHIGLSKAVYILNYPCSKGLNLFVPTSGPCTQLLNVTSGSGISINSSFKHTGREDFPPTLYTI